jgi:DNA primase
MGFRAIGRSNCQTGLPYIKTLLQRHTAIRQVIVVADNDQVGTQGAHDLAKALYGAIQVGVLEVPKDHKDVRCWFLSGATKQDVIDRSRVL